MTSVRGPIPGWSLRLAIAIVGALLLLGVAVGAFEDRLAAGERRQEIRQEAAVLARSVGAALLSNNLGAARADLVALKANPEIVSAAAYDIRGNPIGAISHNGASPFVTYASAVRTSASDENCVLMPVMQKGSRLGAVYLSALPENAGTRAARMGGVALLAATAALVFAILAAERAAVEGSRVELDRRVADLLAANQSRREAEIRREPGEALYQSQKMEAIGQLSGGIAHDLNHYLAVISSSLHLLKRRGSRSEAEVQTYIEFALDGVDRAAGLTRRLLALARRQPLLPQAIAPEKMITGMLDFVRRTVGEHVVVEVRLTSSWLISCDPSQLEAVILNLAINARDAMPHGGKLVIATRDRTVHTLAGMDHYELTPGDYVEIIVRDNGMGMSEDVRRKALEPFFTTKPEGQGTGLGLSTALEYIRECGGSLSIESTPGRGTAIVMLMPRHVPRSQAPV